MLRSGSDDTEFIGPSWSLAWFLVFVPGLAASYSAWLAALAGTAVVVPQ